ncbi:hypothetical protein Tco_0447361 [Tanacetum coccineum]
MSVILFSKVKRILRPLVKVVFSSQTVDDKLCKPTIRNNMRFSLLVLLSRSSQIGLISKKSLDSLYTFFPHEFSIVNIYTSNNTPKHLQNSISGPIKPRGLACETLVDHRQYSSPRLI